MCFSLILLHHFDSCTYKSIIHYGLINSTRYCPGMPLVFLGMKGTILYYEEGQEDKYELIHEFKAKWEDRVFSITNFDIATKRKL